MIVQNFNIFIYSINPKMYEICIFSYTLNLCKNQIHKIYLEKSYFSNIVQPPKLVDVNDINRMTTEIIFFII